MAAENSIYALTLNSTGSISEELAIRLPELRGHLIAIAGAPNGDIYLAGENIYKVASLDNTRNILTYFIDLLSKNNLQINDLSVNVTSKVLSIDFINSNNEMSASPGLPSSPSLQVKVPKALLGGIYDVTTGKYNESLSPSDKSIVNFKLKESRKVTNVGDTIIDINLKNNFPGSDKILIKGQSSTINQSPSKSIAIYR